MSERDDDRPTANEAANAAAQGCIMLVLFVLIILGFLPVMATIAPLP